MYRLRKQTWGHIQGFTQRKGARPYTLLPQEPKPVSQGKTAASAMTGSAHHAKQIEKKNDGDRHAHKPQQYAFHALSFLS
jgi:hypothetical protein